MRASYHDSVKKQIAEVTKNLLQELGHEQVTIRSIAKKLGVSIGSIYTYFLDKTAILREVYASTCEEFLKTLQEIPSNNLTAQEYYISLVILSCKFRIENSYRYREIYYSLEGSEPKELELIRTFMRTQLSNLNLVALNNSQALKNAETTILSLCEGLAMLSLSKNPQNSSYSYTQVITFAIRSLITGWNTPQQQ